MLGVKRTAVGVESFALRIPSQLRERLRSSAVSERRSMNSQIIVLLERALLENEKAEATVTAPAS